MVAAPDLRLLAEDHLDAVEAALAEFPARHRGSGAALARLGIGEINEAVRFEVGVDGHIEQSALPYGNDLRHAGEWLGELAVLRHEAQRPERSVTSILPSGRKASPQGCDNPVATVSTLIVPALVLRGPSTLMP